MTTYYVIGINKFAVHRCAPATLLQIAAWVVWVVARETESLMMKPHRLLLHQVVGVHSCKPSDRILIDDV